jgi:hypothetical protein
VLCGFLVRRLVDARRNPAADHHAHKEQKGANGQHNGSHGSLVHAD